MSDTASAPIRIGVSACLLGEKVRYDGGHKRDPYLVEIFGCYVSGVITPFGGLVPWTSANDFESCGKPRD